MSLLATLPKHKLQKPVRHRGHCKPGIQTPSTPHFCHVLVASASATAGTGWSELSGSSLETALRSCGVNPTLKEIASVTEGNAVDFPKFLEVVGTESFADLVEYCWANSSMPMGKQRIADGHPEPYKLRYIELGNEEYNNNYVEQVTAME
eukprot:gene7774-19436_t